MRKKELHGPVFFHKLESLFHFEKRPGEPMAVDPWPLADFRYNQID
jgi:hypothetical protein